MGFFNWAAPMFRRADRRWTESDVEVIASWLRPSVAPGGQLLDAGGGTGALAARLAAVLHASATVLDPTPQMLRYAQQDGRVTAVLGCAEAIPFADAAFDALIVSDAFHHFRDQPAAASEFRRVLRTGGRLVMLDLDRDAPGLWAVSALERLLGEPAAFVTPSELQAMMEARGIEGTATRERGASYRFVGTAR